MTLKSSGLWCDLCRKPILNGEYWECGVHTESGIERGHSCRECKDRIDSEIEFRDEEHLESE